MHPSEMKNAAVTAAAKAEQDGFIGTAAALLVLAEACADEARELSKQSAGSFARDEINAAQG